MHEASNQYFPSMLIDLLLTCSLLHTPFIAASVLRYSQRVDNQTQTLKQPPLNISWLAGDSGFPPVYNASNNKGMAIICDPPGFGTIVSATSCMDAVEKIGKDLTERQYGQRLLGKFDHLLPHRILSCKSHDRGSPLRMLASSIESCR